MHSVLPHAPFPPRTILSTYACTHTCAQEPYDWVSKVVACIQIYILYNMFEEGEKGEET